MLLTRKRDKHLNVFRNLETTRPLAWWSSRLLSTRPRVLLGKTLQKGFSSQRDHCSFLGGIIVILRISLFHKNNITFYLVLSKQANAYLHGSRKAFGLDQDLLVLDDWILLELLCFIFQCRHGAPQIQSSKA